MRSTRHSDDEILERSTRRRTGRAAREGRDRASARVAVLLSPRPQPRRWLGAAGGEREGLHHRLRPRRHRRWLAFPPPPASAATARVRGRGPRRRSARQGCAPPSRGVRPRAAAAVEAHRCCTAGRHPRTARGEHLGARAAVRCPRAAVGVSVDDALDCAAGHSFVVRRAVVARSCGDARECALTGTTPAVNALVHRRRTVLLAFWSEHTQLIRRLRRRGARPR